IPPDSALYFFLSPPPPISTLFPYTTLFRSILRHLVVSHVHRREQLHRRRYERLARRSRDERLRHPREPDIVGALEVAIEVVDQAVVGLHVVSGDDQIPGLELPRNRQPGTDEPDLIAEGNRGGVLRVPDANPLIRGDSGSRGVTPRAQVLVAATVDANTVADRHLG